MFVVRLDIIEMMRGWLVGFGLDGVVMVGGSGIVGEGGFIVGFTD